MMSAGPNATNKDSTAPSNPGTPRCPNSATQRARLIRPWRTVASDSVAGPASPANAPSPRWPTGDPVADRAIAQAVVKVGYAALPDDDLESVFGVDGGYPDRMVGHAETPGAVVLPKESSE